MGTFETERENVGPGWQPLIEELDAEIRAIDPEYRVDQIKEKFGGLRYYLYISSDEPEKYDAVMELVAEAEERSFVICEMCGTTENVSTKVRPGSWWIKTLCDKCREE